MRQILSTSWAVHNMLLSFLFQLLTWCRNVGGYLFIYLLWWGFLFIMYMTGRERQSVHQRLSYQQPVIASVFAVVYIHILSFYNLIISYCIGEIIKHRMRCCFSENKQQQLWKLTQFFSVLFSFMTHTSRLKWVN